MIDDDDDDDDEDDDGGGGGDDVMMMMMNFFPSARMRCLMVRKSYSNSAALTEAAEENPPASPCTQGSHCAPRMGV